MKQVEIVNGHGSTPKFFVANIPVNWSIERWQIYIARGCAILALVFAVAPIYGQLSAVGPNCRHVNASLDISGATYFSLEDVLTNFAVATPARVSINRSNGSPVFGPAVLNGEQIIFNACKLLTETLVITVQTEGGACWSNLTFKQLNPPEIASRSETVFCFDSAVFTPDLANPPMVMVPCADPFEAKYVTDWLIPYTCVPGVQDTVKMILREWEAYDKYGRRSFSFDTIVVLQFPEIDADHIYCEERDTVYCGDTTLNIGPFITYEAIDLSCDTIWLVNTSDVDNDGMLEFYPTVFDTKCGLEVFLHYNKFKGECGNIYKVTANIKQSCYGAPDLGCIVTPPAGMAPNMAVQIAPGYWRCDFWLYDLDTLGPVMYCKGEELFTGPFALNNWNISANPLSAPITGKFFDPEHTIDTSGVPYQLKINSFYDALSVPTKENEPTSIGLGPFLQNAELKYLAERDESFDFGWTFNLDPFEEIIFPDKNLNVPIQYATVTFYLYLNGEEFAIIEGDDIELTSVNSRSFNGGVLLAESRNGLLSIPLKPGDELILRASWFSPSRATLVFYGANIVSTSKEDCAAHTYIPPLYVADDWTGVKQVKAIVESVGSFIMSYDKADSCWVSHETIKLPKNGEFYKINYEAFDSCHNYSQDSCYIYIKDRIKPVPVMDKSVSLTLSGKKTWLGVDAFDEGSWDNCGVNLVLIRRSDWQEACLDLCNVLDTCYITEHHDTIWQPILETDKEVDEVEAHYARTLEWLCEDETICGELVYNSWLYSLMKYASLECKEHAYDFNFKKTFKEAYYYDSYFRSKFETCDSTSSASLSTAEIFSPFHLDPGDIVDLFEQLGGGWSDAVPFSCEDACGPVTVEMLVMDYWCNWTKIWDQVWVEDKTPPKVVKDVSPDETITCKTYRTNRYKYPGESHPVSIEYLVEKAKTKEQAAFDALDNIFGGYEKAWIDPYGHFVDINGDSINCDILFYDSTCNCTSKTEKIFVYDEHLGSYWKDTVITNCFYNEDTVIMQKGIVAVNCAENVFCAQEVWCEIDHCGEGYLHRKFKIWQSCADSFYYHQNIEGAERHPIDTIYRHQRIYIGNTNVLNKNMFDIPRDTSINVCGVAYDKSGNVIGEAGPENTGYAKYKFDDDCRIIGIGHKDKVFKIVGGEEACFKIARTWYLADWCGVGGEPLKQNWWEYDGLALDSCVQYILVIDNQPPLCLIKGPVHNGDTIEMGGCAYQLNVTVEASDLCGLTNHSWELKKLLKGSSPMLQDDGKGALKATDEQFKISSANLLPGNYKLVVHLQDECNNESYCEYFFSIKSVKKPTPVCITSLTAKLTPWDSDQDGLVDTAHAVVWAVEFDQSSSPTCGDDSLEFRLEILTGDANDDTAAGDKNFLELGCADIGTRMVRLWVISHPSRSVDYCDVLLVVQSDFNGCEPLVNGGSPKLQLDRTVENLGSDRKDAQEGSSSAVALSLPFNPGEDIPQEEFSLSQNRPNPFMHETVIEFILPKSMQAVLTIFDLNGKTIKQYTGNYYRGKNMIAIKREELPEVGMLFYRLDAADFSAVRRMILMP